MHFLPFVNHPFQKVFFSACAENMTLEIGACFIFNVSGYSLGDILPLMIGSVVVKIFFVIAEVSSVNDYFSVMAFFVCFDDSVGWVILLFGIQFGC